MHNLDFLDIERVEVLKGPQGTFYGGNSESGVINVITRQPTDTFSGSISCDVGAYPSADEDPFFSKIRAGVSGPLRPDQLYFGVSGMWENNEGYMINAETDEDDAGEMKRYNGRFTLRHTPSDAFSVSLVADAMKNEDKIGVYRFETGPYITDPYTVRHEQTDWSDENGNGQALKIKYQGSGFEFLSVTGRRDYVNNNQQDYDCTSDPMNNWGEVVADYDDRILTQEFRLSSDNAAAFKWLCGIYAFNEDTKIQRANAVAMTDDLTRIDNKGYAIYGNGTYTFFDRLHFSAGLRYDVQFQEGASRRQFYDGSSDSPGGLSLEKNQNFKELLPRVSMGYDLADNIYAYGLVSKGFLAGGYNYSMATDPYTFTYDPEYVWNHEAGIKASWLDGRLLTSLSLFYLKILDKQVFEQITGSNPGTKIDNAAKAHTQGLELEISARPVRGLDLFAGLGIIKGKYDDWIATEWNDTFTGHTKTDYSGKELPNVPEYTFNLGAQYRFINGFFIRADVNGVGSFYGDHANTVKEKEYALANLKLGYESENSMFMFGARMCLTSITTPSSTIGTVWNLSRTVSP